MKKGTNNRYGKKANKKVIRPIARKKPKKKFNADGITYATMNTGCCGMHIFEDDGDPW